VITGKPIKAADEKGERSAISSREAAPDHLPQSAVAYLAESRRTSGKLMPEHVELTADGEALGFGIGSQEGVPVVLTGRRESWLLAHHGLYFALHLHGIQGTEKTFSAKLPLENFSPSIPNL